MHYGLLTMLRLLPAVVSAPGVVGQPVRPSPPPFIAPLSEQSCRAARAEVTVLYVAAGGDAADLVFKCVVIDLPTPPVGTP